MSSDFIRAFWYISNNFGDNLNHFLITQISKKPVTYAYNRDREHYIVCGSILSECNNWSTICGAGLGAEYQRVNMNAKFCSVRGNLSKDIINKDIPVGDPAVLLPLLYDPLRWEKKHEQGFIPHWSDYEWALKNIEGVKIIDPFLPVAQFIEEVVSCEKVISSGLHGLIVCDAYGVPNAWMNIQNMDTFKFRDYYSTTEEECDEVKTLDFEPCKVHNYKYSKHELLKSYPFYAQ